MRKILTAICLFVVLSISTSCGKWFETSDNGKLDGNWHLMSVDTIGGGTADLSSLHRFMAVQGSILQLRDNDAYSRYLFRFSQSEGRLSIYDARVLDREVDDSLVTDVSVLAPFGINRLEETFSIEFDGGGKMKLTGDHLRLNFRKF